MSKGRVRRQKNRVTKSKTLAVTEYGKDGEPKPKLYPVKLTMQEAIEKYGTKEPNMPTVDELVDMGIQGKINAAKEEAYQHALTHPVNPVGSAADVLTLQALTKYRDDLVEIARKREEREKALAQLGFSDSVDATHYTLWRASSDGSYKQIDGGSEVLSPLYKPKSDIRPKPVPTFDPKPRKIDLE